MGSGEDGSDRVLNCVELSEAVTPIARETLYGV